MIDVLYQSVPKYKHRLCTNMILTFTYIMVRTSVVRVLVALNSAATPLLLHLLLQLALAVDVHIRTPAT